MTSFTDAKTWYPGIEYRPDLDEKEPFFFRDNDASTVVPSLDNEIYSTRVVDKNGKVLYRLFGTGLGDGHVLGTGNPTDGRPAIPDEDYGTYADLSLGVKVRILKTGNKNKEVWVNIRPGNKDASPAAIADRAARPRPNRRPWRRRPPRRKRPPKRAVGNRNHAIRRLTLRGEPPVVFFRVDVLPVRRP